ncbi:MAG TPA: type II toxin-antitoxin system HicB family antitoxin [Draconibacterium sp.]|nr:type II toxin-antitoxin system HicB family antitoxin [Draconibacterium sp.]
MAEFKSQLKNSDFRICLYFCENGCKMKLTLVIKKGNSNFLVGQLKELPEVFTQGKDIQELRENIHDALEMYLEDVI